MQTLLEQMFQPAASAKPASGIEKTAEADFRTGLLGEPSFEDEMEALSDEELEAIIAEFDESPDPEEELAKVASAKTFGEVACHSYLNEGELIKLAAANGVCRRCKEEPVDRSLHPTLGPACLPS
jgi:hypothetical protein